MHRLADRRPGLEGGTKAGGGYDRDVAFDLDRGVGEVRGLIQQGLDADASLRSDESRLGAMAVRIGGAERHDAGVRKPDVGGALAPAAEDTAAWRMLDAHRRSEIVPIRGRETG